MTFCRSAHGKDSALLGERKPTVELQNDPVGVVAEDPSAGGDLPFSREEDQDVTLLSSCRVQGSDNPFVETPCLWKEHALGKVADVHGEGRTWGMEVTSPNVSSDSLCVHGGGHDHQLAAESPQE